MPQAVTCRCGALVPFADEDRGYEVYCPSCGQANTIPALPSLAEPAAPLGAVARAEPDSTATQRRLATVFSGTGAAEIAHQVVGNVACSCGTAVAVTLEDVGATVYCPSCGGGVRVTAAAFARSAGSSTVEDDGPPKPAPPLAPSPRPVRRRAPGFLAAGILVAAAAFGFSITWHDPELVASLTGWTPIRSTSAPIGPPRKAAEVPALDAADLPDAELRTVTLEQINELLRRRDVRAALVDAQIWQQWLADVDVGETDPRRVRLVEVIAELTRRLTPKPQPPPAYVGEFRKLLALLREALAAEDLEAARAGFKKADELFRQHAADLAPFSQTLLVLKGKLRQLEALQEGITRIAQLLEEADEHAREDRPSEAIRAECWAKFLALETPLTEQEAMRLDQMVRDLAPKLRLARGKRAVAELEKCLDGGDAKTRDFLGHEAMSFLPGLPEGQVSGLVQRAETLRRQPPRKPDPDFAAQVDWRRHYEALLQSFAVGETAQTLDACVKAVKEFAQQIDDSQREALGTIAFEIIEPQIIRWTSVPETTPGLTEKLAEARGLLERLTPWREHARYRMLAGALERQQDKLALGALERASDLAGSNKLADAVSAAQAAAELGGSTAKEKIQQQIDAWQQEIERRADLALQEKRLGEIRQTLGAGRVPQAWRLLQEFRRDYPETPHAAEIDKLKSEMEPVLAERLTGLFADIERHWQAEDWLAFRETGEILLVAPAPERFAAHLKRIRDALADLDRQASGRFNDLERRYGAMTNAKGVAAFAAGLAEVLILNPKHDRARKLFEEAKKLHEDYCSRSYRVAEQLLRQQRPEPARRRLEELLQLDPKGPWGEKARKLLARAAKSS